MTAGISKLRTLFERFGSQPEMVTVIRNLDKKQMLQQAKNFKGQEYRIHSIGDTFSIYTEQEILCYEVEEEALRLHKRWGDEESFWRYEYNYQSSSVRAIHNKAVNTLYEENGMPPGDRQQERAVTEHKRWNAYMRTLGYVYSGSTAKESRNDLAKLHNDLVPYDQLSEKEKDKDFDE